MVPQNLVPNLRRSIRRHIKPLLAEVACTLYRLDRVQGMAVAPADPASIILQCKFATEAELTTFREGAIAASLEKVKAEIGHETCMILETELSEIGI